MIRTETSLKRLSDFPRPDLYPTESGDKQQRAEKQAAKFLRQKFGVTFQDNLEQEE